MSFNSDFISQFLLYIYRVLGWNSCLIGLTQSDLLTSLSRDSWLVFSCISSQWAQCSIFKYLALVCCSSRSTLQKPSTFPSSTCIDLLWGDSCMLYGGYSYGYMCSSSISYMLAAACCGCIVGSSKQQHSRSIPPRLNTWTFSCTLPCKSLRELSWQNLILRAILMLYFAILTFSSQFWLLFSQFCVYILPSWEQFWHILQFCLYVLQFWFLFSQIWVYILEFWLYILQFCYKNSKLWDKPRIVRQMYSVVETSLVAVYLARESEDVCLIRDHRFSWNLVFS